MPGFDSLAGLQFAGVPMAGKGLLKPGLWVRFPPLAPNIINVVNKTINKSMAKIETQTDSDSGMGILRPQISHRFRVRFPCTLSSAEQSHLTCQIESCTIDYGKRQLSLVVVQDAITTVLHEIFMKLCKFDEKLFHKEQFLVHIDSLDGNTTDPINILEFNCTSASHEFKLDYADSDIAKHYLTLDIVRLLPYNSKDNLAAVSARFDIKEDTDMT